MMEPGTIIFLNGTSSSGKTTIAKLLQQILDGYYIHTGLDHYLERVPEKFHIHTSQMASAGKEGFVWIHDNNNSGQVKKILVGEAGLCLLQGMYKAAAALASAGNNLIIDDVLFAPQALHLAVKALSDRHVLFVGVRCPLEVAEERERERGDRFLGLVRVHYELIHAHNIYDLEVDTSKQSPMECAKRLKEYLQNGSRPFAFMLLKERLFSDHYSQGSVLDNETMNYA
jgi:chloramphenicol 3-O phosphotransferase